jgi:Leucine-rich repeat (LRR) protein
MIENTLSMRLGMSANVDSRVGIRNVINSLFEGKKPKSVSKNQQEVFDRIVRLGNSLVKKLFGVSKEGQEAYAVVNSSANFYRNVLVTILESINLKKESISSAGNAGKPQGPSNGPKAPTSPPNEPTTDRNAALREIVDWANINKIPEEVLPRNLKELAKRTGLNLKGLELTDLPPAIGQLTNLRTLYLSTNYLKSLPPEMENLSNLSYLSLRFNPLGNVPSVVSKLTGLTHLDLGDTKLTEVPAEIGNLTSLEEISLGTNLLTALPEEMKKLSGLNVIWVNNNYLDGATVQNLESMFPKATIKAENQKKEAPTAPTEAPKEPPTTKEVALERLIKWADDNNISESTLPRDLGELNKITFLNLSHLKLTSIPPEIGYLDNLERLYLAHNELQSLPPEIVQLSKLADLNLNANKCYSQSNTIVINMISSTFILYEKTIQHICLILFSCTFHHTKYHTHKYHRRHKYQ